MHCTMIVPTISEEYQMFECALRQKYHTSLSLPSSFQPVRTAATMATTIPCDVSETEWKDWNMTYQAHGHAKPNLLGLSHIEFPRDDPRKRSQHEIHDDVVD
jgi:hypothetical protein